MPTPLETLLALKAECQDIEGEEPHDHEAHRAALETAYAAINDEPTESNEAPADEVTELEAHVIVTAGVNEPITEA